MHWYQSLLLAGAVIAGYLAWNVPRAILWISLGALSFVASSWWHDAGLPYGAAFGAATNVFICFMLYAYALQRWEMRVWNMFHAMILIDLLYLTGVVKSHYDFAFALEVANWFVLLIIGTTGISERAARGVHAGPHGVHRPGLVHRALWAERARPPFWQAR